MKNHIMNFARKLYTDLGGEKTSNRWSIIISVCALSISFISLFITPKSTTIEIDTFNYESQPILVATSPLYYVIKDKNLIQKHASLTSYEYEFSTDPVELAFMNTGRGTMYNLDIKWPIETLRQYYHLSCGVNSDIVDVVLGTEGDDGLIYPSGASWSIGGVKYQYLHYSSIGIYDYHLDNTTFLSPACANSSIIKIPDIFLACIDSYLSGILIYSEDHVILPEYEIGSRYDFLPIYGLITYTDTQNKTIHKTLRIDCFVRSCYLTEPAGSRYNVTIQLVPSIHDAEDFLFNNQQYIWYTTI